MVEPWRGHEFLPRADKLRPETYRLVIRVCDCHGTLSQRDNTPVKFRE